METKEQKSILLVDDANDLRETLGLALRASGYLVHEASDGQCALEILQSNPGPHFALLTDFTMPLVSGGELLKALENGPYQFEIYVLISGQDKHDPEIKTIVETMWKAPLEVLPKPFNASELIQLLKSARKVSS